MGSTMTTELQLNDGLTNLSTVLGARVNQLHYGYQPDVFNNELDAMWESNWVVNKICGKRAYDMVRRWREISSNDVDADQLEKIERLERVLKIRDVVEQACVWASLYGGVGILLISDRTLDYPIDPTQELRRLVLVHKNFISPVGNRNNDVMSPNFGRYDYYQITTGDRLQYVHYSRLILVNARPNVLSQQYSPDIWGKSDLAPVYETLKRYDAMSINVGDLVHECKVDVFKMNGLTNALASGQENSIASAIANVQAIKSTTNSLLLDAENDYEQKELAFAGLKDLLVEFRNAVAGAADMPVTILFGQSAAGFASGAEDIQNYHESIHALQESRVRPILERIDPILCQMALGSMPEDWWFEFPSLAELTTEQQVTALNTFSQATGSLMQSGVLTSSQVANELKETGLFTNISAEDIAELDELEQTDDTTDDEFARDYQQQPENQTEEVQAL